MRVPSWRRAGRQQDHGVGPREWLLELVTRQFTLQLGLSGRQRSEGQCDFHRLPGSDRRFRKVQQDLRAGTANPFAGTLDSGQL